MPSLRLAELVDRKVAGELAALNGQLEQLVAEAVDRELDQLVHRLVEANLEARAEHNADRDTPMTEAT